MSAPTENFNRNENSSNPTMRVSTGSSIARRDQLISLAVILVCFVGILIMHPIISRQRGTMVKERHDVFRQLSVEFPRLTLGGFRGILVPILWQRAENNKNERQWTELDSMYNIIGKLQPYFVSVYIFNAWNQAYNLSAQWHSIDEKYKWVLDGLGHLYEGEEFNPDNRDIFVETAQMYFLKLGGSFERITYRQFWRSDIEHQYQLDPNVTAGGSEGASQLDTRRKVRNFILRPQFNTQLIALPDQPDKLGYGVEITGLVPDDPKKPVQFRYGLSPFYFAYKEYQRSIADGRYPSTMGKQVSASFPAMSLRMWVRDDVYFSQSIMKEMFQYKPNNGEAKGTIPDFDRKVLMVRDCFRNIKLITPQAVDAFAVYSKEYPENFVRVHAKHQLEVMWTETIGEAEEQLFEGLVSWQLNDRKMVQNTDEGKKIIPYMTSAIEKYTYAIGMLDQYLNKIYPDPNHTDRADFMKYQNAMRTRIEGIKSFLLAAPTDEPNFDFLTPDTVER